jgi:hypothetical protein
MGRVLTIKRAEGKSPLLLTEVRRFIGGDAALEDCVHTIYWTNAIGIRRFINVDSDKLWTDDLRGDEENQFQSKLQGIARGLDAELFESQQVDPSLPTVAEAQRIIHDAKLCHSATKCMASYALVEACEHDLCITIEDMLRCLDYGGVIAENGARCLYVRTGRDGLGWKSAGWNDLPYVVKRADWEAYLHAHYRNDIG